MKAWSLVIAAALFCAQAHSQTAIVADTEGFAPARVNDKVYMWVKKDTYVFYGFDCTKKVLRRSDPKTDYKAVDNDETQAFIAKPFIAPTPEEARLLAHACSSY